MSNWDRGARLQFDMADLRPIIEHARAAKEYRKPYGGKPSPSLCFVKDSGIYLMSAGLPAQPDPKHSGPSTKLLVAYAKGYEDDAPDSFDKCVEAVGGDDFSESLPLAWFTSALDEGATRLTLLVAEKGIRCTHDAPPEPVAMAVVRSSVTGQWNYCPEAARALLRLEFDDERSGLRTAAAAIAAAKRNPTVPKGSTFTTYETPLQYPRRTK